MASRGVVPFAGQSWEQEAEGERALVCQVDGARWAIVEDAPACGRPEFCEVGHEGYVISGEIRYESFRETASSPRPERLRVADG